MNRQRSCRLLKKKNSSYWYYYWENHFISQTRYKKLFCVDNLQTIYTRNNLVEDSCPTSDLQTFPENKPAAKSFWDYPAVAPAKDGHGLPSRSGGQTAMKIRAIVTTMVAML